MQYIKTTLFLFIHFLSYGAFSQAIFIGDDQTNRKLEWSDFRGKPDHNSSHHAVTTWYMSYNMENIKTYGDSIYVGKLMAMLKMEPNESWIKREKASDELLKHEQGHFNIGILCLREFLNVYSQTTFRKSNFDAKMKQIFSQTLNKYHQLGIEYDRETDHSKNKEAQQFWNEFFIKSIGN